MEINFLFFTQWIIETTMLVWAMVDGGGFNGVSITQISTNKKKNFRNKTNYWFANSWTNSIESTTLKKKKKEADII